MWKRSFSALCTALENSTKTLQKQEMFSVKAANTVQDNALYRYPRSTQVEVKLGLVRLFKKLVELKVHELIFHT